MRSVPTLVPLFLGCLVAGSALQSLAADELRLKDGRVLVGSVKKKGELLQVATRDGVVEVRAEEVLRTRTDKELRAALADLAKKLREKDTAFTRLQLARTAWTWGLSRQMWTHLDRCVEQVGDERGTAMQRQLRKFLATLESELLTPTQRQGSPKKRVKMLVNKVRDSAGPARRAAVLELLVREPDAVPQLQDSSRRGLLPEQRVVAVAALRRRPEPGNETFGYRRLVLENDKKVRQAMADHVRDNGDTSAAIRYLAPGFLHAQPAIRMRTAEAFANLADQEAVPFLAAAGPLAGTPARAAGSGPGVRAHMFQITQRAYIRDFDVEIAQAAAVANPVVGTVSDGVVLDVNVGGVFAMRVPITNSYRRALRRLVGQDPGGDPNQWEAWARGR